MAEGKTFEKLSLLYQENAKVAAIFWDWRNKIITYFSTSIVALFTLSGWLYQYRPGRFISAPLFMGAIISVVLAFLDGRNGEILKASYQCGRDIEIDLLETIEGEMLVKKNGGIFQLIGKAHFNDESPNSVNFIQRMTYTKTLRVTFILLAALLSLLAVANLIWPNGLPV